MTTAVFKDRVSEVRLAQHYTVFKLHRVVVLLFVMCTLSGCGSLLDPDDEGGVIGTGIEPGGTVSADKLRLPGALQPETPDGDITSYSVDADEQYLEEINID